MSTQNFNDILPDAVMMSDWAVDENSIGNSVESIVYEILLLSLLYDNILIRTLPV